MARRASARPGRRSCLWLGVALCLVATVFDRAVADRDVERVLRAMAELRRTQMERILCLDTLDVATLVRMTGRPRPCEVVMEAGDPSFGVVRVIGQIHDSQGPQSSFEDECTAHYQLAILQRLLDAHAPTVFIEGWEAGSALSLDSKVLSLLRESFARIPDVDSFPAGLDTRQALLLKKAGAPLIYRALRSDPSILGADDTTALERASGHPLPELDFDDLFTLRERRAMQAVCTYLSAHRGADVTVVFGAGHVFDSSLVPRGTPVPRILMTTFPGLVAASPVGQPHVVERLVGNPALLHEYLGRLVYLDPECFALLPEKVQLQALGMVFAPGPAIGDGDGLERLLLKGAKSQAVRSAIKKDRFQFVPVRWE